MQGADAKSARRKKSKAQSKSGVGEGDKGTRDGPDEVLGAECRVQNAECNW